MFTLLYGFIVPRLIIKAYGSEINGFIASATQFITYFNLVEAGISGAAIYSLYKPLSERNETKISSIVCAAKNFYIQSGYIFAAMVLFLALGYPLVVSVPGLAYWQICLTVLCIGSAGAMDFFTLSKYRVLLTADQRSYVISFGQMVMFSANIIIVAVFAAFRFNIAAMQAALVCSVILRSLILWAYTKKKYPYLDYNAAPDNTAIKDRWNVLYLEILVGVQTSGPIILATIFTSLAQVSVYSIYNMVIGGINGLFAVFISGLAASFGQVLVKGQRKILQNAYQEFEQVYYIGITIVYSVALLMIIPFIKLYIGAVSDINYIVPILGFLFVLNGLMYNIKTPQSMMVISAGMYRQTRFASSMHALLAFGAGAVLAPVWGLEGIVIAFIASNIYRTAFFTFFVPRNITKLSYKRSLKRMLLVLFNFSIAVFIFFKFKIECANFYQWIMCGTVLTLLVSVWVIALNLLSDYKNMKKIFCRLQKLLRGYLKY